MQRREHKVAGERRFHGNLRCFLVARFTDEDDVGILPQEGAKNTRKIEPDILVRLDLAKSGRSYSIGSSAVEMLISGELISVSEL